MVLGTSGGAFNEASPELRHRLEPPAPVLERCVIQLHVDVSEPLSKRATDAPQIFNLTAPDICCVCKPIVQVPPAVVVRNQDDATGTGQVGEKLHPSPSRPRELGEIVDQRQRLHTSGDRQQRVPRNAQTLPKKTLKVRLISGVATVNDQYPVVRCTRVNRSRLECFHVFLRGGCGRQGGVKRVSSAFNGAHSDRWKYRRSRLRWRPRYPSSLSGLSR